MPAKPWYQNTTALLIACLALPPLGIILLWLRPGMGIFRKLLFSLALAGFFVGHLFWFYGMHVELAGSGMAPIISFNDPQRHYAELEDPQRHRVIPAEQQTAPAESAEPAVPAATPESAEAAPSLPDTAAKVERPAVVAADAYWSDFRDPQRAGRYEQTPINTNWPASGLPELWRQTVGGGYASMVIANGRVFSIEQRRTDEVVAAYDLGSGGELWAYGWPAQFEEQMGGPGPRATPVWNDGRIYALGATGELQVLDDKTGKLIWNKNILSDNGASNLMWGMSAAPLIVDDKVIVQPGGSNGRSIVAYHKLTGEPIWKSLDDRQAYTSPMDITLGGQRQILTVSAERLMGIAIEDGALLWEFPWTTTYDANISQPLIVDDEHVFISAGYSHGSALVKVTRDGDGFRADQVWQNNSLKCRFNSPVLFEGTVYGLDEGILAAIDVRTGERKWKGGRYGYGQVVLAGGHLIVLTESGEVALVKATPESHQEIAKFAAIDGKTWNNPAIANGRLIVRNQTEMACYDLSPGASGT